MNIYEKNTNEYKNAHRNVTYQLGAASLYDCKCGKIAEHWAHIHNTCMDDSDNYIAMCVKCHHHYDRDSYVGNSYNTGTKNSHSKLTEAEVRQIRKEYKEGGITQKEIAELYRVQEPAIYKIISYRTWSHI